MGNVTVASFKAKFARGQFQYGTALPDILDQDIADAIAEKDSVFNPGLYPSDAPEIGTLCELYLAAHFLVTDIDAADSGGQTRLLQNSRSVDGVSESLEIPDWMKKGEFAFYASTYYGQKWLILTKPYLDGAVFSIGGATQP
jgi:hypothetical protein